MSFGLIGREIDERYRILAIIGHGGMATVYKAFDTRLEREVAVKVLRRDIFLPEELEPLRVRFEREAKSLARLSHPNIVPVTDYGEFEGAPYLVMIYVPGGTLIDRLGKPTPWKDAIRQLLPVARALEYIHNNNIINRDVKPSNILLRENGEPMMTDFGLVKLYEAQGRDITRLTSSSTGLGTPYYSAPEQWSGEATAQSDLYSLGVILYEMITAHRPYEADTPAKVLLKQAKEPLPLPKTYIPDLPLDVEAVLLKALAKEPVQRYANMKVFISELENLLAGKKVTASTIKIEQLRDQVIKTVVETSTEETLVATRPVVAPSAPPIHTPMPPPPVAAPVPERRIFTLPGILIIFLGGFILIAGIGGCWLLFANPGILPANLGTSLATQTPVSTTVIYVYQTATTSPDLTQPTTTVSPISSTPTEETLPEEIRDERNVPMRFVPAGQFSMGSDDNPEGSSNPAHTVFVDAFYIDKFEVTNEMYDACVYATACRKPRNPGSITRTVYYGDPRFADYPVLYVDWGMAAAYCAWRDARLPTEAEWEKAARGMDGRLYPWDSQERDCYYSNLTGCMDDTTPVDAYAQGQSSYGVYDLSGNVWEWTSSLFQPYPYNPDDGREDPLAPGTRVLRGGAWSTFGADQGPARSDTRLELDPSYYGAYVGFRCAKDIAAE